MDKCDIAASSNQQYIMIVCIFSVISSIPINRMQLLWQKRYGLDWPVAEDVDRDSDGMGMGIGDGDLVAARA